MEVNNQELVSVVIPTYNRGKIIKRCIDSVLKQTYQKFELLIVDDGSTDNTREVIEQYADDRIQYYYQQNGGAQVARNNGLHHAVGKYISFLDSDDYWLPTFLEKMVSCFDKHDVGCVYCQSGIYKDGELTYAHYDTLTGNIYAKALKQGYITSPTFMLIKRKCFDTIGDWDVKLIASQDDDICFRLSKYYEFFLIDEILAVYTVDGENKIMGSSLRVAKGFYFLWQKYESEVIQYCGKKVIGRHYWDCYKMFKKCENIEFANKAKKKARQYLSYLRICQYEFSILFNRILRHLSMKITTN